MDITKQIYVYGVYFYSIYVFILFILSCITKLSALVKIIDALT